MIVALNAKAFRAPVLLTGVTFCDYTPAYSELTSPCTSLLGLQ